MRSICSNFDSDSEVSTKMEHQAGLPQHIIMDEILTRLPLKSLCRFKSVSKLWNVLISSARFAKAHYALSKARGDTKCIFVQQMQDSWLLNYEAFDHADQVGQEIWEVLDFNDWFIWVTQAPTPIGSSCGLVCLLVQRKREDQFFLINPIRRRRRVIYSPARCDVGFCGFSYVSSVDDFKIVVGLESMIYVFSLRSNNWREIGGEYFDASLSNPVHLKGILVNDILHWWMEPTRCDNNGRILAFDLVNEVTREIPVPKALVSKRPSMDTLDAIGVSSMGGCLCLYVLWETSKMEFWMLKQYGKWDSWVRLYDIDVPICYEPTIIDIFGFTRKGKFLMHRWSTAPVSRFPLDEMILVDPDQSCPEFKRIRVGHISYGVDYVKSLVSPFGFMAPTPAEMEGIVQLCESD